MRPVIWLGDSRKTMQEFPKKVRIDIGAALFTAQCGTKTHRSMRNMTRKKIEFEVSSGNVFADLGLDDADELYIRAALGVQVMTILDKRGLSQKESAEILGIKQPEVSAIMQAKFRKFSQERLIGFLNRLNQKVTIQVSKHRKGEPYQQVTVAS